MKILLVGDIVGRPGRKAVHKIVSKLRKEKKIDFVVANAENAAGGSGLTIDIVDELLRSNVDVLTSGDHIWKKKEIYERLENDRRILRPANYPKSCPGRGAATFKLPNGVTIGVINVLGRVFMDNINDCPFKAAEKMAKHLSSEAKVILVDIHAEATSEKIALGRFLDGKVTALFGTHTHVQTADEKILPKGTAYITDLGMTGSQDSIIGRKVENIVEHFLTCMPTRFEIAENDIELQGVLIEADEKTGKAISIEKVREKIEKYT